MRSRRSPSQRPWHSIPPYSVRGAPPLGQSRHAGAHGGLSVFRLARRAPAATVALLAWAHAWWLALPPCARGQSGPYAAHIAPQRPGTPSLAAPSISLELPRGRRARPLRGHAPGTCGRVVRAAYYK
eukprot:scaffold5014_cov387-Prasinococcus_capsulatus_cf.AAC.12